MRKTIGHDDAKARWAEANHPSTTLIRGPKGVGKTTLALELAATVAAPTNLTHTKKLDVDTAREIRRTASTRPLTGTRAFVIDITARDERPLNTLLKTIEEPPRNNHFLLTSSIPLPLTIISRCQLRLDLQPLTAGQLATVLTITKRATAEEAPTLADRAAGSTLTAEGLITASALRPKLLQYLKAIRDKDEDLLSHALTDWSPSHTTLLTTWAAGTLTGNDPFHIEDKDAIPTARRLLNTLNNGSRSRPAARLAALTAIHAPR